MTPPYKPINFIRFILRIVLCCISNDLTFKKNNEFFVKLSGMLPNDLVDWELRIDRALPEKHTFMLDQTPPSDSQ